MRAAGGFLTGLPTSVPSFERQKSMNVSRETLSLKRFLGYWRQAVLPGKRDDWQDAGTKLGRIRCCLPQVEARKCGIEAIYLFFLI